jgi:signal recognition particle receptor subunit beta
MTNPRKESQRDTPAASTSSDEVPEMLQARVRQTLTPYLPPPVVEGIKQIDAQLQGIVGPEASVTVVSTLMVGWLILLLVRLVSTRVGGSGRAIAGEDEDHVLSGSSLQKTVGHNATVLLCGPSLTGKTRLFYQLCHGLPNMPTVMSIKANVGVSSDSNEDENHARSIRYMDWPGHASLEDPVLKPVLQEKPRIVLVLDSTQPVAAAADALYQLLVTYNRMSHKKKATPGSIPVFVACHKKDILKAKNWRRCKIQIRTELERLLSVRREKTETDVSGAADVWWPAGEPLDLEKLPAGVQLHFASTTCEGKGSPELKQFCQTGVLPTEEGA